MNKKLNIYSWNVLNSNANINYMTWKTLCKSKHSKKLAVIDLERYHSFRKDAILDILNYWLNSGPNVVICLQEVCDDLLQSIKLLDVTVHNTKLINDNCQATIIKGFTAVSKSTLLNIGNKEKFVLITILDDEVEVNNLHLHWTWTKDDIIKAGKIVDDGLKKEYIVMCGDFNKTLEDVQPFLDEFNCLLLDDEVEGYTGIYPATGKKEIIDHIFLSSNIHHKSDLKIISRVKDYQIIYNVEKIVDLYDNYWSCDKWLLVRPNKDVSDHKAVKVTIKIKID